MSTRESVGPEAADQEECVELSDFDKGQVVVAHRLGMSVSETARMVGCSPAAVVSTLRQWRGEGWSGENDLSAEKEKGKMSGRGEED